MFKDYKYIVISKTYITSFFRFLLLSTSNVRMSEGTFCHVEVHIYVDYKPSKQIRNICKFHTCKYLFFNLLFYIYSKIINMHLSFKFLRETPRKRVLSINPGNYLSRRNTEKFHRETPRNFAQTISSTWLISRCFSEK